MEKQFAAINYIDKCLSKGTTKQKGTGNELLIAGNMYKYGFNVQVLADNSPNYDIKISKGNKTNYIECKLDMLVDKTGNFYFEYWNYTYNRPTGINSNDLNTLYSHTYKVDGQYYHLISKRSNFIDAIRQAIAKESDKVRIYNNTYYINGKVTGDKAYIIDKATFLKYFKGCNKKLSASFRWKGIQPI